MLKRIMAGTAAVIALFACTPAPASETVHYELTLGAGALRFTKDPVLQSFYKNSYVPVYNLDVGVLFYHFVGIDGSLGFVYGKNTIYAQPGIGEQYVLMVYPARLDAVLQLRIKDDQPVYPYVGAGGVATGFYQVRSSDKKTVSGYRYGYDWMAGIHFLLDPIDMRHVGNLRTEYGIDHVYIDVRIGQDVVNDFGKGLGFDFTDQYISGAFGFEF
ncbi:MAG: porin family protein [Deltaproteobacteria bacterium]|nr:porin family protein [Deltaproteobacteria bacterium]MCL5277127.1 porin family protein [Deltaproteobacteria bacterium]